MTKLKPCPFCGGEVRYNFDGSMEPNGILCMTCRSLIRYMRIKHKKKDPYSVVMAELAEAWNRRVGEADEKQSER